MNIRKATSEDIKAVSAIYIDTWKTTYKGLVPDEYLHSLSYEEAETKWGQFMAEFEHKSSIFVAVNEIDEIVGFAATQMMSQKDQTGELYALYLLPKAQGLGAGRRLVSAVAKYLRNEQMSSMLVWVMKKNEAGRGFYKRLGATHYAHRESEFGGLTVEDEAYIWNDLSILV